MMNSDNNTTIWPHHPEIAQDFRRAFSVDGKLNNLPYPSLGDTFKEPEIICDMLDYYFFEQPLEKQSPPCTSVVVHGERGGGKTRSAVEYAWSRADRFTALLFVTAHDWWTFRDHLAYLCPVLGIQPETTDEDERASTVARWLVDPAHAGWLLIIDGVDSDESAAMVNDFLTKVSGGHVIVTCFCDFFGWNASSHYLAQPDLAQSVEYLLERTEGKRSAGEDDAATAAELAEALKFTPLAMEMASAYIGMQGISLGEYLTLWRATQPEVAPKVDGYDVEYTTPCAVAWTLCQDILPAEALSLLFMLSWLYSDPLPRLLFDRSAGSAELQQNTAGLPTPNEILRKLSDDETADMDAALALLRGYGLLQPAAECTLPSEGRLHTTVLLISRQWQPLENRPKSLQAALDLVNGATLVKPHLENAWPVWEAMAEHVLTIVGYAWSAEVDHPTIRLAHDLGQLVLFKGKLELAESIMKQALVVEQKALGPNYPDLGPRLHTLASVLVTNGREAEAEPLLRRLLEILSDSSAKGIEMPLFETLNMLGTVLIRQGRDEEAEAVARRALALGEKIMPPDDPHLANALLNLVSALRSVPRLPEAEPFLRRALAIYEGHYGLEHPKVADLLNSLAVLLQNTNRPAEAEMVMRRALHIDEKALGPVHPNVARDLHCIAFYFQDEKRFADAEPLIRRALAIEEQCFGPEHMKIATALNNLALVLADSQREDEAEPLMRRALAINEKAYGPDHEEVAILLNNLSQLIEARQPDESERMMRRQLVIFLKLSRESGHDHPTLPKAIGNYLKMLRSRLKDLKEIEQRLADLGPEAGFDEINFRRLRKRAGLHV